MDISEFETLCEVIRATGRTIIIGQALFTWAICVLVILRTGKE